MTSVNSRRKPRQKRSIEKVERILDATEALVVESDIDSMTTTQVAERTGFAIGTIYQYYSNRTDLLMAAHDRMHERISKDIAQAASALDVMNCDPVDMLIRLYVDKAKAYPGYLSFLRFSNFNKSLYHSGALADAAVGELVSFFVRYYAPDASEIQWEISRTVIVSVLSVLTDVALLEKDPERQEYYVREMVATCRFLLKKGSCSPSSHDLQ